MNKRRLPACHDRSGICFANTETEEQKHDETDLSALLCALLIWALLPGAALAADVGDFSVTGTGLVSETDYSYDASQHVLTILSGKAMTVGMKSGVTSPTTDRIDVASGVSANLTLNSVSISVASGNAMNINNASVNLTLAGDNFLETSDPYKAALRLPAGSSLIVAGSGSLKAAASHTDGHGAGIGGGGAYSDYASATGGNGGTVTVNGGSLHAESVEGAAIGGATGRPGGNFSYPGGSGGKLTVNGGAVRAAASSGGAAIGGGYGQSGGAGAEVTINGGTVTARNVGGVAIGGGNTVNNSSLRGGAGGTLTVKGGTLSVESTADDCAAIGGGCSSSNSDANRINTDCTVTITGGAVTVRGTQAIDGHYSYGIAANNLTIRGGTVTVQGTKSTDYDNFGRALYYVPNLDAVAATASANYNGSPWESYNPARNDDYQWFRTIGIPSGLPGDGVPKTGDAATPLLWAGVLLLAGTGLFVRVRKRRKA